MAYKHSILLAAQLFFLRCLSLPQGTLPAVSPPASAGTPAPSASLTATCIETRAPADPAGTAISAALASASAVSNACGDNHQVATIGLIGYIYYQVDEMFLNVTHPTDTAEPIEVSPSFCPDHFQAILDQCITNGSAWGGWIDVDSANYSITNFVYPANGLKAPPGGGSPGTGTGTGVASTPPASLPPGSTPPASQPPGSTSPASLQPGSTPPASQPLGSTPPASQPPGSTSPASQPSGSTPPASQPPGSTPPASQPPGSTPPASQPPGSTPPASQTPGSTPPASQPPGSTLPASQPPGSTPPASQPPGSTPPASQPPGSTPPASQPPGSTPPASQSPGSTPPASQPPGSTPPASQPPGSTPPASQPPGTTPLVSQPLPTGATVVVATINSQVISETFVPTTNPQFVSLTTVLSTFSTNSAGSTVSYEIGPGGVEWQPLTPSGTNQPNLPPPTALPSNPNGPTPSGTPAPSGPSGTPSTPPSATPTPGHTNTPPSTTQSPSAGAQSTGPLPVITSYSSDFSSVATVAGITGNTHISTSDGSHHGGIYPFVFGCWFCGGGGFVLWGMTLPGIYPPPINPPVPHWPTITVGSDGEPTPDPSESPSASAPSNTQPTHTPTTNPSTTQHTTTASSCVSSSIPSCTQAVSVSGSSTITTSSCTTVFACSGTATTGVSTTTASGGPYCSPGSCGDSCAPTGAAKREVNALDIGKRLATPDDYAKDTAARESLFSRTKNDLARRGYIENPTDSEFRGNMDRFITEQIGSPGKKPLYLPSTNPDSTAQTIAFDAPPGPSYNYLPSISSLEGCTAIIIIGEKGCWISHFWEQPWFIGYKGNAQDGKANFQKNVLDPLNNGNGGNMPSPFAAEGQSAPIPELADGDTGYKPEIFVVTLQENGAYTYDDEVKLMEQALTGEGKAFAGITPQRVGYQRAPPDSQSANGKVLIQYTNEQENDMGEPLVCPATAIYKVWVEKNQVGADRPGHQWPASGNQVPQGAPGNKKRQEAVCKPGQTGTFTGSGTGTGIPSGTGSAAPSGTGPGSSPHPSGPLSSPPGSVTPVPSTGTGPITSPPAPSSTYKPPTCMHNPVDQDPPNCTNPPSTSSTYKPPACMHNPVDQDPPNCTNPPSSSQPFSCSAGSNVGVATYDPATWCGCNSATGTLYATLPSGSGDAACAYTALPSQTVNPTAVS